jgi:transcriptional regulator with XRE-family HTH domain
MGILQSSMKESRERLVWKRWGRRIRQERQVAGLTQEQLAARVDVRQSTVSKWELGDLAPGDEEKMRLAEALGRPLDTLFAWPDTFPPRKVAA